MSEGHLYLSPHGGLDYASDSRTAWYDQAHSSMFLICPNSKKLRQLALNTSVQKEVDPINDSETSVRLLYDLSNHFPEQNDTKSVSSVIAESIMGIKLSLDRQYLAIQRSDVQVQVIHLSSGEVYWVCIKPKSGNRILNDGIMWNTHSYQPGSSQDLFVITKMGMEQYRVSPKRRNCALHRFINVLVHNFWYDPDHSVLIVSSGNRANEIIPFLLCGSAAERLQKLTFASSIQKNDLFLAPMYNQLFIIYGDMRAAKLLVYSIEKSRVFCIKSFNLLFPPGTAFDFSVVDNLLVCHSLDFNVSLFFDIKSEYNCSNPFSSPLPISLDPPQMMKKALVRETHRDLVKNFVSKTSLEHSKDLDDVQSSNIVRMATLPTHGTNGEENSSSVSNVSAKMDHHHSIDGKEGSEYLTQWHFLQPNLVRQSIQVKDRKDIFEQVEIRKLQLNLREISKSSTRNPDLIPFLLRRGDDKVVKELVLKSIHDTLLENISLSQAFYLFALVQTLSYRAETHSSILEEYNAKSSESSWSNSNSSGTGSRSSGSSSSSDEEEDGIPMTASRVTRKGFATRVVPAVIRNRFFSDDKKLNHLDSKTKVPSLRNAQGEVLIFQSEFFHQVWHRLLLNDEIVSSGRLNMYVTEYIRSLQQNNFPVENITYLALVKSFLASGKQNELYQFLQYQVPLDSIELADILLKESKSSSLHLVQVALDMYLRLEVYVPMIKALLVLGETSKAMALAWQKFSSNRNHEGISSELMVNARNIPGSLFYDSMVRSMIQKKSSALIVIKELESLILFLQNWDPNSLQSYQENGNVSLLSIQAQEPFPSINGSMYIAPILRLQRKLGFASNLTVPS